LQHDPSVFRGAWNQMDVELIQNLDRIDEIRESWTGLLSNSSSRDFFLLPEWFFLWWKFNGKNKTLCFVILRDNDEMIGLFPLYRCRKGPVKMLTIAGLPYMSDRVDFILKRGREEECLRVFSRWMRTRNDWDVCQLRNIGTFSRIADLLADVLRENGTRFVFAPDDPYFFVRTADYDGFEDYLQRHINQKHRKNLRRLRNRVMKLEGARWDILDRVEPRLFGEMVELDSERSLRGKPGFLSYHTSFVKNVVNEFQSKDMVRMITFRAEDRLYSFALVFLFDEKILGYQMLTDRNMCKNKLGTLTLMECLRYAFENNYRECDFLKGDERYKSDWTTSFHRSKRILVCNKCAKSLLVYTYYRQVKPIRKKMRNNRLLNRLISQRIRALLDI
jgi:CelD/BcsL family acetyltransferase involved in cellulose biosynthesis